MALSAPNHEAFAIERRAARRVRTSCPASLRTLTGQDTGQLLDLSTSGARVQLADPPGSGTAAHLLWGTHLAACTVVWAADGACGVVFETALDEAVVLETAQLSRVVEQPIAVVRNIALGRKRSSRTAREPMLTAPEEHGSRTWSVPLSKPQGSPGSRRRAPMTAAEEMFFFGAPLAHILAYESRFLSS